MALARRILRAWRMKWRTSPFATLADFAGSLQSGLHYELQTIEATPTRARAQPSHLIFLTGKVNDEWMLLDGRNRREAAKLAGIIPPVIVTDVEPKLAVHRSNNQNRDATPGQKAMATALAYPEKQQGKKSTSVFNTEVSNAYLNHARFVLRNCRDKALEVLHNAKYPLTVAYEEAQAIVEKQRIAEEERQRQLAALAVLREEFSDLAALVDDQRLGLPEAIAAGDQRREHGECAKASRKT